MLDEITSKTEMKFSFIQYEIGNIPEDFRG